MSGDKDKGDADIRQDFPGGWLTKQCFYQRRQNSGTKTNILISLPNYLTGENNEAVHFKNDPLHS
jgi:hypothetical protein